MSSKIEEIKAALSKYKRKSDRLSLPVKLFYSLLDSSKWMSPVSIEDIGGGGARFRSKNKIDKEAEINLKIVLPDRSDPIIFKGEVIWCKKASSLKTKKIKGAGNIYHIGVKFGKMNYNDRRRFVSYICDGILFRNLDRHGQIKL